MTPTGDFKPTNVMLASQPGEPIDVQFIDFELAGPNYRGYDIYKLFRRGQPPPPPTTSSAATATDAAATTDTAAAADAQGDAVTEPMLNTSATMDTATAAASSSVTSSTAATSSEQTPPPAAAAAVAEPDTRALRSFVSAYLEAIDANEQLCRDQIDSQTGNSQTQKATAVSDDNDGARNSNQAAGAAAANELASASAAARALLAAVVDAEDDISRSTTSSPSVGASGLVSTSSSGTTASPTSSSSSSNGNGSTLAEKTDDVTALESLMAEVSIFEPLTWFEAAVFFLFAIQVLDIHTNERQRNIRESQCKVKERVEKIEWKVKIKRSTIAYGRVCLFT